MKRCFARAFYYARRVTYQLLLRYSLYTEQVAHSRFIGCRRLFETNTYYWSGSTKVAGRF